MRTITEQKLREINNKISSIRQSLYEKRNLPFDEFLKYLDDIFYPEIQKAYNTAYNLKDDLFYRNIIPSDENPDFIHDLILEEINDYPENYEVTIIYSQYLSVLGHFDTIAKVKKNDGLIYYLSVATTHIYEIS